MVTVATLDPPATRVVSVAMTPAKEATARKRVVNCIFMESVFVELGMVFTNDESLFKKGFGKGEIWGGEFLAFFFGGLAVLKREWD